jgi:hypothetical protein
VDLTELRAAEPQADVATVACRQAAESYDQKLWNGGMKKAAYSSV